MISFAETYVVDPFESSAEFKVKSTFSTHEGKNAEINGDLKISKDGILESVYISVPINQFRTGNPEMDCHLQESLGLNYQKSDFPEEHVCKENQLESKGKNGVEYPTLSFTSDHGISLNGIEKKIVKAKWGIHGVNLELETPVLISRLGKKILVSGSMGLKLSDFGVVVKKFLFISVSDDVQVKWDVSFVPEEQK